MADNPVETAANELKKWLEQLKKIMAMKEAQEKALQAEQKAIGDKALAAHKEMVAKTKHDELMKELKDIKEGIKNTPETPGKDEALKQAEELEESLDDLGQDESLEIKDPDSVEQSEEVDGQSPEVADPGETIGDPGDIDLSEATDSVEQAVDGIQEATEGLTEGIQAIGAGGIPAPAAGVKLEGPQAPAIEIDGPKPEEPKVKPGSVRESLAKEGYNLKNDGPKIDIKPGIKM